MTFESVDALQRTLAAKVFHYAADRKKAAGRALGTLVEIVTFYTLRAWGLRDHIVIERSVPEFANPDIVHNVEFLLHPAGITDPYGRGLLTEGRLLRSARTVGCGDSHHLRLPLEFGRLRS